MMNNVDVKPEKRTYTVEEVAAVLGIGRSSAYRLVNEGVFPVVRVGTAIRVPIKTFEEWMECKG